jgi:hypothetical protein
MLYAMFIPITYDNESGWSVNCLAAPAPFDLLHENIVIAKPIHIATFVI